MKQYDTMEDLLNEYNKPETQQRLNKLRDQELGVLETKSVQESIIRFSAKQEEVIRLAKGKFYYRGEEVEDKYQVYERFNEWLTLAENTATISKDK
jgi:broad specificity phosphatase PhoE